MIPDEDLEQALRDLADDLGQTPTNRDMHEKGQYSPTTYQNRYGSWNAAVKSVGLEPNQEHIYNTDEELLNELKQASDSDLAPSSEDYPGSVSHRFGSFWRGVVAADLTPRVRAPLTDAEFDSIHTTALNQQNTTHTLAVLFLLFTGLSAHLLEQLSGSWVQYRSYGDPIVRVPSSVTASGKEWEFKIPSKFTTRDGETKQTHLPGLLSWYLSHRDMPIMSHRQGTNILSTVAAKADLPERPQVQTTITSGCEELVPKVSPSDLRITGGVKMARNGAPARRISRRLGIDHTGWNVSVEDIFFYCEVNYDGFSHSDWNPEENPNWNFEWA